MNRSSLLPFKPSFLGLVLAASTCFLSSLALTSAANAVAPLRLDYSITPAGAQGFYYEFELTLENSQGSWTPGNGFGWIVFGHAGPNLPSPIADFTLDPATFPVGPWNAIAASTGFHNGPSLTPVLNDWIPTAVGDSLTWAGWSQVDGGLDMTWSALSNTPLVSIQFEPSNRPTIPEPTTICLVLSMGLLVGCGHRRR